MQGCARLTHIPARRYPTAERVMTNIGVRKRPDKIFVYFLRVKAANVTQSEGTCFGHCQLTKVTNA